MKKLPKATLIAILKAKEDLVTRQDARINELWERSRVAENNLKAAKESLAELEKVQHEIVARLEQAYLALVKVALK